MKATTRAIIKSARKYGYAPKGGNTRKLTAAHIREFRKAGNGEIVSNRYKSRGGA